jgi:predicted Zn-dependent protease
LVLLGANSATAKTELLKTQSGSLVHWTKPEIFVGLAPSAASQNVAQDGVELAIQRAAETWNAVRAGQPRLNIALGPNAEVTIKFCREKWRGDTIDLGKSQFTANLRDGTVAAATIELNECDHAFTAPGEATTGGWDLQAVITHELGHVLGLGHSDNPAAVMHPNGRGAELRKPHSDDMTALALIYFGRAAVEFQADGFEDNSRAPADQHPNALRFRREEVPTPADRPSSNLRPSTGQGGSAAATPDLVTVLNLTDGGGRQVLLYTGEPTLLPPIGTVPAQDAERPMGRRARSHGRQGLALGTR